MDELKHVENNISKVARSLRRLHKAVAECSQEERLAIVQCFNETIEPKKISVYYVIDCLGHVMSYGGLSPVEMSVALEENNASST